jgi:rRNA processing protein Krr1/Pno1
MNKTDTFYMEIKRNREYLQLEQGYIAKLMSKHTGINFTIDEVEKILTTLSITQYLIIDDNNNHANASGYRVMSPWVFQEKW